jgi:carboxypeptidase C (cathepsin A)
MTRPLCATLLVLPLLATAAPADPAAPHALHAPRGDEEPNSLDDDVVTTEHTVTIDGRELRYEARAGTIVLREEDGTPKASVFHVAYLLADGGDTARRPVTFCFNGGPGSSSVWLHLGTFGPRRVVMDGPEGWPPPPPYRLAENEHSLLDLTDLVFIDPVTTGFSRAAPGEEAAQFHGFDPDVRWIAELIRLWTTREKRWSSPKFLAGESYGTTRAAGLAGELQQRHGMYLNGLVLVSSVLSFNTVRFDAGNDLPFVLFLPTYAATAFYHGKLDEELSADLQATLREVEAFAAGEYASALLAGDRLEPERASDLARRVARYTGLDPAYVERTNLRVQIHRFVKELLREERQTVGRLDSRYRGVDRDAAGERYEMDPSYAAIQGPYTGALNQYVRADLGFESDLPYEILTGRVHPWSYASFENRYLDVAETMRREMHRNRALNVFVASGYYDLATPYAATDHTLAQMQLDPELRGNVSVAYYESGHMMYVRDADREKLKRDLAEFYARAVPAPR